ncbi:MAG: hypothetical protein AAB677_00370 [Patescibacteria group bacterium]
MKRFADYLDELRRRPEPARRRVLVLTAGSLTVVIFLVWLLNLKFLTSGGGQTANVGSVNSVETLERIKTGWQVLIKRLKD